MRIDQSQPNGTSLLLLEQLQQGDDGAAEALFARYFERLTALARSRLSRRLASRTDPEDIVMSVYRSFFIGARMGRFTVSRGGDLWRLLASITKHKLLREIRYHEADRRSVDIESPLDPNGEGRFPGRQLDPSPYAAAALAEEVEWVLAQLDPFGRRVLELRLQGAQLAEIGLDTGRSERTIRRILARARQLLAQRFDEDFPQIDRELERELADRRPIAVAAHSAPTRARKRPSFDGPLLSYRDFLLQRMIGAGQMGKVYQSWQRSASRAVAVKFLRKTFIHQPGVVERFIGEARTIARLKHPNVVGIHGLGQTPGNAYFIVMDLVPGPNLDQIIKTRLISADEAIQWSIQVSHALEHAHARGIIHCDLKPANLLLDADGTVRVTDFGLARSLTELTPWTAEVEGTAPFMAPEQASRSWGEIGVRTDVYGIGAVLYNLLTGRPPWIGRRLPDILANVISAAPVVAPSSLRPELSEALSDLCHKCLAKAPEDRYPTIHDVRSILTGLNSRAGTRLDP
jgi:eukaryotic-like serine/threonine-protein kinase